MQPCFLWDVITHAWLNLNRYAIYSKLVKLTNKKLETNGCVLITEATEALVLNHQAISMHSVDQISIALD